MPRGVSEPVRVLADRFELRSQLGTGGMGEVYRAHDRARDQAIALKVLPALDATALLRFKHEFRALHDVQHPNLVALHELHEHGGTWFFTMQLVDGVDFLNWVGDDENRLRDALAQVAQALFRLHESDLVHRDLKSSNVRVTCDGKAMLLDFGLVAPAWAPGEAAGTPAFMAPEQIDGDVTPASDWYSFGVLMFRALTGRLPFEGAPDEVMQAKLTRSPPRVRDVARDAPEDLAALADQLLAREPAARPSGETILRVLHGSSGRAVRQTVVVGREDELSQLREAMTQRLQGGRLAVSVAGESGIGKTTLLRAFAEDVEQSGAAWVLSGRCWERESVPYKGFDAVIDEVTARIEQEDWQLDAAGWAPILVQAFPVLRRLPAFSGFELAQHIGGHQTAARLSSAVRWLLGEIASRQPLVIIIDDLQWADRDTIALVRSTIEPALPNVLLVVGAREHIELATATQVRRISLGPLSPDDTATLVRMVVDEHRGDLDTTVIARETGGHPLFATELARHAVATGSVRSLKFDVAVREIAARAGRDAEELMQMISLANHPIAVDVAARASARTRASFFEAVGALREGRLIATSGVGTSSQLEPAHDRVRQAFIEPLTEDTKRSLHERIASAFESVPDADLYALAHHWDEAGRRGVAAKYAMRAAEQAETALAFHRAADLYAWVLELDPAHPEALRRRADALAQAGVGVDAADAYLACAQVEQGVAALDLRRRAMQQLLLMGHSERAFALLDQLASELDIPNPTRPGLLLLALLRSRFALRRRAPVLPPVTSEEPDARMLARIDVLWDASAGLAFVDPLRAFYFHSLDLELSFRSGDRARLARSLLGDAPYLAASGKPTRRLSELRRLAVELSDVFPVGESLVRGVTAFCQGRWRECQTQLDTCEQMMLRQRPRIVKEGIGPAHLLDITRRLQLCAMIYRGLMREVRHRVPELLHEALERNDIVSATHLRTGLQTFALLAMGDVDTARQHADDGIAPWRDKRVGIPHFMDLQARTSLELYTGVGDGAYPRVREWWPRLSRAGLFRAQYLHIATLDLRGRAAVAFALTRHDKERRRALADARDCARALVRTGADWGMALSAGLDAAIALADEDPRAPTLLARAAAAYVNADMMVHARLFDLAAGSESARDELAHAGIADVDTYSRVWLPRC